MSANNAIATDLAVWVVQQQAYLDRLLMSEPKRYAGERLRLTAEYLGKVEASLRMSSNASDTEQAVENAARQTIDNLQKGMIGSGTIRDLGQAVDRAKRDLGVGRAIGGTPRQ